MCSLLSTFIAVVSAPVPPPHLYFQIWYCFHPLSLFLCSLAAFVLLPFAFADLAHHLQLCMSFMVEGSRLLHIGSHQRFMREHHWVHHYWKQVILWRTQTAVLMTRTTQMDHCCMTKLEQLILGHDNSIIPLSITLWLWVNWVVDFHILSFQLVGWKDLFVRLPSV